LILKEKRVILKKEINLKTMNKKILLISLIILLFAGTATAAVIFLFYYPYEPDQPLIIEKHEDNIVDKENDESDQYPIADDAKSTEEGIKNVVNANNEFSFDLYPKLAESNSSNIFYSPYSIYSAMAMTYEGAQGKTADEMKFVFRFPESNILRSNFAAIYNKINEENEAYELKTGNALWVQKDYAFLKDYLDRIKKYYGGKAENLDFINEKEKSRKTINAFIEEQTNNKIKDLIPAGFINELTRLVLTNAIYFKGTWEWEFDESKTREEDFKIAPDNTVKVQMMNMSPDPDKIKFNYAKTDDLQMLELPYKGNKISMLILLPSKDLESIESSLTVEKINDYKNEMKETKLDSISLPKFEFDTKYFINDALKELGMPTAFSGNADFSGMTGQKDLFISSVIHQAYIKVDEKGTEAAAATAVTMKLGIILEKEIFNADHPFIFIIQEKDTGNILFSGRVVNPTK